MVTSPAKKFSNQHVSQERSLKQKQNKPALTKYLSKLSSPVRQDEQRHTEQWECIIEANL